MRRFALALTVVVALALTLAAWHFGDRAPSMAAGAAWGALAAAMLHGWLGARPRPAAARIAFDPAHGLLLGFDGAVPTPATVRFCAAWLLVLQVPSAAAWRPGRRLVLWPDAVDATTWRRLQAIARWTSPARADPAARIAA